MNYSDYRHLVFDLKPNGVLLITINRPEVLNATNARLHWELTQVWLTVDADPKVRVALVTGAGKAFSAGGAPGMVEGVAGNPHRGRAGAPAAILWPLLCGMAKAKYYLLTAEFLDGREAERIGLVSLCVPAGKVMDVAGTVAEARGRA